MQRYAGCLSGVGSDDRHEGLAGLASESAATQRGWESVGSHPLQVLLAERVARRSADLGSDIGEVSVAHDTTERIGGP